MKTALTPNRRTQWLAGAIAGLASSLTLGGPLVLAEHYAQTGASREASGYYAAEQTRRIGCPGNRHLRTAEVSPRRAADNS